MPARDPEHRAIVARIAAAERWGRTADRSAATAPARAGLRAKYAAQVDPHNTLDPAERERRVDCLVRAHMLRMTLKAKAARRRARAGAAAEAAESALAAESGGADVA